MSPLDYTYDDVTALRCADLVAGHLTGAALRRVRHNGAAKYTESLIRKAFKAAGHEVQDGR